MMLYFFSIYLSLPFEYVKNHTAGCEIILSVIGLNPLKTLFSSCHPSSGMTIIPALTGTFRLRLRVPVSGRPKGTDLYR